VAPATRPPFTLGLGSKAGRNTGNISGKQFKDNDGDDGKWSDFESNEFDHEDIYNTHSIMKIRGDDDNNGGGGSIDFMDNVDLQSTFASSTFPPTYLVLKLIPNIQPAAVTWLVKKITGKKQDGGAELLLRCEPFRGRKKEVHNIFRFSS